tara:strand:- start:189 stop:497 length:309 start_codon:yes stop_codon:yes gene_type:complete
LGQRPFAPLPSEQYTFASSPVIEQRQYPSATSMIAMPSETLHAAKTSVVYCSQTVLLALSSPVGQYADAELTHLLPLNESPEGQESNFGTPTTLLHVLPDLV